MLLLVKYVLSTSTHSSTHRIQFELAQGETTSRQFGFEGGYRQCDKMQSVQGLVFIEHFQCLVLDNQNGLWDALVSNMSEGNRSWRTCCLKVGDYMMMSTRDLRITYMNQLYSPYKLQHQCASCKKINMFCWPNAVRLELQANQMIHDPVHISWLNQYMVSRAQYEPLPSPVRIVRS